MTQIYNVTLWVNAVVKIQQGLTVIPRSLTILATVVKTFYRFVVKKKLPTLLQSELVPDCDVCIIHTEELNNRTLFRTVS
jgi:hypothetical protein